MPFFCPSPTTVSLEQAFIAAAIGFVEFSCVNWSTRPKMKFQNVFLKSLVPRVHSMLSFVLERAMLTWALILLSFRAFEENFRVKNLSISHRKLNSSCLPLHPNNRNENKLNKRYADKYNENSLFCLEGLSFVVLARSFAMCGQARSFIAENKRSN